MSLPANSTKLFQKISFEGDNMVIKNTFDASHVLRDVRQARETTENAFGSDYKHIGNIDPGMLAMWLKEAGVAWSDTAGMKDVIKRKMMSPDFSALRVWEGSY